MDDVFGFKFVDRKPTSEGVHIGTCGTAYDCPRNQKTYILVHNKMLFFGDELYQAIKNPNNIWNYHITFWDNPFDNDRGLVIETSNERNITLIMKGTKIGLMSQVPT